jgi:hypothetical protein
MTAAPTASRAAGLFTVHVHDAVNAALAGHDGCEYTSPPQSHAQAVALVRLLLGRPVPPAGGAQSWTVSIAGGRRTISLVPAPNRRP